ncbi:MAG: hypothetical protein WCO45_06935 [Pseudanabaena sp. ELA607]
MPNLVKVWLSLPFLREFVDFQLDFTQFFQLDIYIFCYLLQRIFLKIRGQ